jgi:hypothetical protein
MYALFSSFCSPWLFGYETLPLRVFSLVLQSHILGGLPVPPLQGDHLTTKGWLYLSSVSIALLFILID